MALVWHFFRGAEWPADSVWYDTRNAGDNLQSQLFYSYSTDAGATWSPNVPVSGAFNPTEGWPQQNKIGDYITIVSDNTGGNVAYSATFNLNPTRDSTNRTFTMCACFQRAVRLLQPLQPPHSNGNGNGNSYSNATAQLLLAATSTPTATATPRPTPTPRGELSPRPRPTPLPRP